jgi:HEAT repeat protein
MTSSLITAISILFAIVGGGVAQTAKPDPADVVFEDKPLRWWLEGRSGGRGIDDYQNAEPVLRRFCAKHAIALPALTAALADKNELVRRAAAECLGYYLTEDVRASAIPPLLKALQEDESGEVRWRAAAGLGVCGPQDKLALAGLFKALKEDEYAEVRSTVIITFREIKPPNVLPALTTALKDKEGSVRCGAVLALGELGDANTVIPLLIDCLNDVKYAKAGNNEVTPSLHLSAAISLSYRCPEAIPALRKALKDKNALVRSGALLALAQTKDKKNVWPLICKEVPAILPLLDDKDSDVRWRAANILGQIKALEAVPVLAAKLNDEDSSVRFQCSDALGRIGPDAVVAVDKLIDQLKKDCDPDVRGVTAQTLGKIGPKAKAAVPGLIEALQDKNASVRRSAAHALGEIGSDAKAAVPKLKESLKTDDEELQRQITEALKKIGAE